PSHSGPSWPASAHRKIPMGSMPNDESASLRGRRADSADGRSRRDVSRLLVSLAVAALAGCGRIARTKEPYDPMVPFDVYGAILNNRRFLGVKRMGERSAGNPHAAFDVEGTGDVHRPLRSACCPRSAPQLPL